jgi:hypothetical protein
MFLLALRRAGCPAISNHDLLRKAFAVLVFDGRGISLIASVSSSKIRNDEGGSRRRLHVSNHFG